MEDNLELIVSPPNVEEEAPNDMEPDITPTELLYSLEDFPPLHISAFLGVQHFLTMIGSAVAIPFILISALCIEDEDPARSAILSTTFFVEGLVTLVQVTIGIRLPIVQGATGAYLAPILTILSLEHNKCPANFASHGWASDMSSEERTEMAKENERDSGLHHHGIIGTSVVGLVMRFITPLTIAPVITVLGLSLIPVATNYCSTDWLISLMTVLLIVGCSQYLYNKEISLGSMLKNGPIRVPIFKLFPILLAVALMWSLCLVLTLTDLLSPGNSARTDRKLAQLARAEWFQLPYPFQWGWPTFSVAGTIGVLMGVGVSSVESIGDYYACARLCGVPPPPMHAVNRANFMEGLGSVFGGVMGAGNGTTSYSQNIAVINISRVGSRVVVLHTALLLILCGLFAKVGAFFLALPVPIVGGICCVMFSVVTAVGLANLHFVNLNSSRNLLILGFSILFPLMLSNYLDGNESSIQLGNDMAHQIVVVVLKTPMFGAGLIGLILDNTVPGSASDKDLKGQRNMSATENEEIIENSPYDLPFGMNFLRRYIKWTRLVPILPTYRTKWAQETKTTTV